MPQPERRKVLDQVLIQLIEADVESGFSLVDEAKAYRLQGNRDFSCRALQQAEAIVADIERRLTAFKDSEARPFLPLLTELREQIAAAGGEDS